MYWTTEAGPNHVANPTCCQWKHEPICFYLEKKNIQPISYLVKTSSQTITFKQNIQPVIYLVNTRSQPITYLVKQNIQTIIYLVKNIP